MRKFTSLLLAAAMLLVLTACGALTKPAAETPAPAPAAETVAGEEEGETEPEPAADPGEGSPVEQPDLSNAPDAINEDQQALLEQFIFLDDVVQPGTAGSSLRAAAAAATLLDWAEKDALSDEALTVVIDYMAAKTVEDQAAFGEKLDAVESAIEVLTGKDKEQAEQLLADAGMLESCGYPWSKDAVGVIDRLMEALGRRAG